MLNNAREKTLDDMQVAEACKELGDVSICRVEAYFATNCDLSTVRLDIYENDCDAPADPQDVALATFEWTSLQDTGEFSDGLPLYKFIFRCLPGEIPTGRNYWLSIYSEQGFAADKRSVWAWSEPGVCGRRLNEAMYRNPAIGFDPATPQSDAFLAGTPQGAGIRRVGLRTEGRKLSFEPGLLVWVRAGDSRVLGHPAS